MKKHKILYVYHVSSIGGGSYCLLNILKHVDRILYTPIVLLKTEGPLADEIRKLGIEVAFMPQMRRVPYNRSLFTPANLKNAIDLLCSLSRFEKILLSVKPDIVYINSMMLYPYLYASKKLNIKTIIHIREHWPIKSHCIQRHIAIKSICSYSDHIVAINSFSQSMFNCILEKTTVVYDWIDLDQRDEYFPLDKIFKEDMANIKVYLFTGGLQPIKGSYEVINTFVKKMQGQEKRLLLLGFSKDYNLVGLRGKLIKFISIFGYESYEKKVCKLVDSDNRIAYIPATYNIKNILEQTYCVLSYFTIPHANLALAESIIANTPIIAARTPESLEYSYNGELALLFRENDIEDFTRSINTLDSEYRILKYKLLRQSHEIENLFDTRKNTKTLNSVYNKVLQ